MSESKRPFRLPVLSADEVESFLREVENAPPPQTNIYTTEKEMMTRSRRQECRGKRVLMELALQTEREQVFLKAFSFYYQTSV